MGLGCAGMAPAQTPEDLYLRSLAATCAACHGTDGRVAPGSRLPALAGMPREDMVRALKAFRDGTRPATVMHQLSKGYSDAQIEQMAGYFARQPRP
ncbi:MAG: c-type cytochrome [Ramlibacter sp.]|nr:c-type cytochrome [Ramlibacter sp.]MBX3660776.1 c-type cytochrome [Ramlibacter sp.]